MRSETFETPGPVRLDVRLGAGELRLETADVRETVVVLEPLRDNDASAGAVENARVELREGADGHEVVIDVRDRGRGALGFLRGAEVLVTVTCPDGTSVESKSGSADVTGRGRFGSVEVESGSGDIEFGEIAEEARINAASGEVQLGAVGGDARINTASGDVQVRSVGGEAKVNSASGDVIVREVAGELSVNSASGDVLVREAGSSVSVNTASGDQEIGSVMRGSVSLKSASGDLKVGIREGSSLWVDARSRSGEVRSELPVSDLPPEGNGPAIELRANTMSGDVTVARA
jgi:Putative adhesin